jgi:hypothetical protein
MILDNQAIYEATAIFRALSSLLGWAPLSSFGTVIFIALNTILLADEAHTHILPLSSWPYMLEDVQGSRGHIVWSWISDQL